MMSTKKVLLLYIFNEEFRGSYPLKKFLSSLQFHTGNGQEGVYNTELVIKLSPNKVMNITQLLDKSALLGMGRHLSLPPCSTRI